MAEKDLAAIQEIKETTIEIKGLMDKFVETNNLRFEMYEEKIKVINHRIFDLENALTWAYRLIIGAIATGAIAFLYK